MHIDTPDYIDFLHSAFRVRGRVRSKRGHFHVRRAVILLGRETAFGRRARDPRAHAHGEIHHRRGARSSRLRLPLRLYLLPLRRPGRLRRRYYALLRAGR